MKVPILPRDGGSRRILAVLFCGVFMGALDIAIVGPALPALQDYFAVDSRALSWVFNLYILFGLLGAPLMAKLSDRYGRRAVYLLDIALFALGSALVASSTSFPVLLAGRAVQAFGAGGLLPVASAVIGDTFLPERRGPALGLVGAVFGIAFLLGPLCGGVLLPFSWRWLFLVNLPLAGIVFWQAARVLPQERNPDRRPFDALGAGLLSIALASLAWAVSEIEVSEPVSSLASLQVLPFLVLAVLAVLLFWKAEHRAADPVLHPQLLRSRELRLVGCIAAGTGLAEAGMVFLPALAVTALGVKDSHGQFHAPAPGVVHDRRRAAGGRVAIESRRETGHPGGSVAGGVRPAGVRAAGADHRDLLSRRRPRRHRAVGTAGRAVALRGDP